MKTTVIEIDGDTEARGRNGGFRSPNGCLHRRPVSRPQHDRDPRLVQAGADCAPVILILPAQAVLNLAHEMTKAGISAAFSARKEENCESRVS